MLPPRPWIYEQADDLAQRNTGEKGTHLPLRCGAQPLQQAAHRLGVPAFIATDIDEADIVMTLRAYYRSRQQPITGG